MKNTKHLFLLSLFLMVAIAAFGQQKPKFSVVSFEPSPLDMSASEKPGARDDGTGTLYAIIKVTSTGTGDDLGAYLFDFDYLKHTVEEKDGELWVYVQRNAKHVTISRSGYRTVRNYDLRTTIEAGKVYRMQLLPEVKTASRSMVRFNISPSNVKAVVMFRDELSGGEENVFGYTDDGGSVARSLELGTYTYKVITDTYHTSEGRIVLNAKNKTHVESVTLRPNFANVTFKAGEGVDIYINEERKGTSVWEGVLKAGAHRVGSSKKGHSNVYIDVDVIAGKDTVIHLPSPKPIIGMLSIVSTPLDAKVIIDGKDYGLTPQNIDSMLIGHHTVEIVKEGYKSEIRNIEIIEDEITECAVQLSRGIGVATTGVTSANTGKVVYNPDGTRRSSRTKTVRGVVFDKNGYPLTGARVEATGGAESTTVGSDGTFSFQVPEWLKYITVKHKGFPARKQKITDGEMLFKMKKREWFLDLVGGYSFENETYPYNTIHEDGEIGLMFGTIANWGWYVKPLYCFESEGFSLTAGITKKITEPLYLYAGIGFTTIKVTDKWDDENSLIPKVDLGLLIRPTTHFNINFGCSGFWGEYKEPDGRDDCAMQGIGISLNLGVGYVF